MLDIQSIKTAARGRWREILLQHGFNDSHLNGRNGPCPKCEGIDRFRFIDEDAGAVYCNQCFSRSNGDGIAAIMWRLDWTFQDTVKSLSSYLNLGADVPSDLVAEMAWRKSTSYQALVAFGAKLDKRGDTTVCRVPMYDAGEKVVGYFDLAPGDLDKGRTTSGSKHGLFMAERLDAGTIVAIVEGVKDASALYAIGIQAVGLPTNRMDAGFARVFRDCHCVIVPDRDAAGIKGALETAAGLYGIAASVKIAELPLEYKETGGGDVRDVLKQRDGEARVKAAIDNARHWTPGQPSGTPIVFYTMADECLKFIDTIEQQSPLLMLGIPGVDKALGGGVAAGEMVIIAGRPSHGKSVCGVQALDELALAGPVLLLSQEMGRKPLAERQLSSISDVKRDDWIGSKETIRDAVERHYRMRHPFLVVETPGTVERAVECIAKAKEEHGVVGVAADYVQLFRCKGNTRYEQVTAASILFKEAATKYDVVLLALCQLNRQSEQTGGAKMSDIRESGQLEQDADVILFVEWLYKSNPAKHNRPDYVVKILKNRNRGIKQFTVPLHFEDERLKLFAVERHRSQDERGNYEPAFDTTEEF